MKKLLKIIQSAQKLNFKNQHKFTSDHYDTLGYSQYAIECQTVAVNVGRGAGHTSAIMQLAVTGDCVICASPARAKQYESQCSTADHDILCSQVFPVSLLWHKQHVDYYTVWVDDASTLKKEDLELVYKTFAGRAHQFVLLG